MPRRLAPLLLAASLASGCGSTTPTASPPVTADPAATPRIPTPIPTPARPAEPTPTPIPACVPGPGADQVLPCDLPSGPFTPAIEPAISFAAGEGWLLHLDLAFVTYLSHEDSSPTGLTFVTEVGDPDGDPIDGGADGFIDYLESIDDLEITGAREEVQVAGQAALQVDVRATSDIPELFHQGPSDGSNRYELLDGRTARIVAIDRDDGVLVIVVEPLAGGDLPASMSVAQPVVDSIALE